MINYNFYYWGPILFRTTIKEIDLNEIQKLCSKNFKKSFNNQLAGHIEHEYLIDEKKINIILNPYLEAFQRCFRKWYNQPLPKLKSVVAWVNYMQPGDFNPVHIHHDCDFSSVLYLDVSKQLQKEIEEYKGTSQGPGSITFFYGEDNFYTISEQSFKPNTGDFFIFPYSLRHSVNPYKTKCERISVSINFKVEEDF